MATIRTLIVGAVLLATASCGGCKKGGPATPPADAAAPADAMAADSGPQFGVIPYLPGRTSAGGDDPTGFVSVLDFDLSALQPKFNACYRAAAKDHPDLAGEIVFHLAIDTGGHATEVSVGSDSGLGVPFVACLRKTLKDGKFTPPPDGGAVALNVPLSFHPPKNGFRPVDGG